MGIVCRKLLFCSEERTFEENHSHSRTLERLLALNKMDRVVVNSVRQRTLSPEETEQLIREGEIKIVDPFRYPRILRNACCYGFCFFLTFATMVLSLFYVVGLEKWVVGWVQNQILIKGGCQDNGRGECPNAAAMARNWLYSN